MPSYIGTGELRGQQGWRVEVNQSRKKMKEFESKEEIEREKHQMRTIKEVTCAYIFIYILYRVSIRATYLLHVPHYTLY